MPENATNDVVYQGKLGQGVEGKDQKRHQCQGKLVPLKTTLEVQTVDETG